jgi:hypothetical protein
VLPEDRTLTITLGDDGIERLDPWPFAADEVTVEIPWRVVPLDGYADDTALQVAIATAPVAQRRTLLQPA